MISLATFSKVHLMESDGDGKYPIVSHPPAVGCILEDIVTDYKGFYRFILKSKTGDVQYNAKGSTLLPGGKMLPGASIPFTIEAPPNLKFAVRFTYFGAPPLVK